MQSRPKRPQDKSRNHGLAFTEVEKGEEIERHLWLSNVRMLLRLDQAGLLPVPLTDSVRRELWLEYNKAEMENHRGKGFF